MGEAVIKFGTDGWRGVIAYDFTADRVKIVTRGVCEYLKHKIKTGSKTLKVVIGYDTRFLSEKFAEITASVFKRNNIEAYISTSFVPTPILSAGVLKNNADLGIMITASHNPYYYNGYKVKGSYGGSATMDIISEIEESVNSQVKKYGSDFTSGDEILSSDDNIEKLDFVPEYSKQILNLVDTDAIRNFNFGLLIDPMYGTCQGIYRNILQSLNPKEVIEIHGVINPLFNDINPEPIGDNLRDAIYKLKEKKCKLAICLDGDGDRIAALGEEGNFISSHHIFAIILWYLLKYKQLEGKVVKTVTTSSIIDRICSKYDLELLIKPVGFKYIGEEILAGGVMMGGEESGGLWVKGNIPERDGMFIGLVLLEVLCTTGKTINEILDEIYKDFGFFVYRRLDYEMDFEKKEKVKKSLSRGVPRILKNEGVKKIITIDGYKYVMEDGSWVMIRPSGTEAVVRIYAESDTIEKLNKLHSLGKKAMDAC